MLSEIFWLVSERRKCKEISCCGFKVVRNVELEEKIDELNIERHQEIKNNDII